MLTTLSSATEFNLPSIQPNSQFDSLFKSLRPDFVINCIGVIKQVDSSKNVTKILPINSIFPHQIAELCEIYNIRFME